MSISNPLVAGSSPAGRARKEAESSSPADAAGPPLAHPLQACNSAIADVDAVERALANAITVAVDEHKFDIVSQLCRELETRRLARSTNVVSLNAKRCAGYSIPPPHDH